MYAALVLSLALQTGGVPPDTIRVSPDTVYIIHKWEQSDSTQINPQASIESEKKTSSVIGVMAGLAMIGVGSYLFFDGHANREVTEIVIKADGDLAFKRESFNDKMLFGLALGFGGVVMAISFK